jgi:hypothetical protein
MAEPRSAHLSRDGAARDGRDGAWP